MGLPAPAISCAIKSILNRCNNPFDVRSDIFIRKMQRRYARSDQLGIAGNILFLYMRPPINLHCQAFAGTVEIDNIRHDHVLTAKLVAGKL